MVEVVVLLGWREGEGVVVEVEKRRRGGDAGGLEGGGGWLKEIAERDFLREGGEGVGDGEGVGRER